MMLISVVMAAHNEEVALPGVIDAVASALARWPHEIIVVDDGSRDGTWTAIVAARGRHAHVRGVRLTRNFGQQAALVAGLRAARGSAVVMMDADGQHPAELLPEFVMRWQDGDVIVQGARRDTASASWLKRTTSRAFYKVWSVLSGVPITPGSADFRLLDRSVVDVMLASAGSLQFLRGLTAWLGYQTRIVEFDARPRAGGTPTYTWPRMLRLSIDALLSYSVVPLRLAIAAGVTIATLSFVDLCYILYMRLFTTQAVTGWASIAGLVSLVGGIQLFTVGVLGEYVGRMFVRTLDRPPFVVAETCGEQRAIETSTAGAGPRPRLTML